MTSEALQPDIMMVPLYSRANIVDGTGFPRDAKFIMVEPGMVTIPDRHLLALIEAAGCGDDMQSWAVAEFFQGIYGNHGSEAYDALCKRLNEREAAAHPEWDDGNDPEDDYDRHLHSLWPEIPPEVP